VKFLKGLPTWNISLNEISYIIPSQTDGFVRANRLDPEHYISWPPRM
jgi:hypothetical protein